MEMISCLQSPATLTQKKEPEVAVKVRLCRPHKCTLFEGTSH
jgi:hypothetical protein